MAERVLSEFGQFGWLTTEEFAKSKVQPGTEIGLLVIPAAHTKDLTDCKYLIETCRASGANLSVLVLAETSQLAEKISLDECFDAMICAQWASAPHLLRQIYKDHKLRVRNHAFRAFLDHSVDGYWIWDLGNDDIIWSDRTREMVGLEEHKVPRNIDQFVDLVHPLDRNRVEQAINNHFQHKTPYKNIEMRVKGAQDTYGHFLANGSALRDQQGKPILLVASMTDNTPMQRVEQLLEDTQKRFSALFHLMNDAAVLADIKTGLILEANQPAERLWGKSISELVGCHQSELHPPVMTDASKKAFSDHAATLIENKRASIQLTIMRADGTEVPTEISSSLIELDEGTAILGVFRDISERIRSERKIRKHDAQIKLSSHLASMGTLAAGVAHEINNPLTYVLGNLDLLKDLMREHKVDSADVDTVIEAALTGSRYVREIVSDLKSISRMDGSDKTCDPCEVIRIASKMAMSDLRHRATLTMDLSPAPKVPLSSTRLSQVILNILSNAARAFRQTDRTKNLIRVAVTQDETSVLIVIEDNGRGISPENLNRVWEPFFTKNAEHGGLGLGLSICRRILNEAEGTLEIQSVLDQGTTVEITLPFIENDKPITTVARPLRPVKVISDHQPSVMIVDDDNLVLTLLARMLQKDYKISTFLNARSALAALETGKIPDIIISDIMMPEMDGQAFYQEICNLGPYEGRFLFVTGGAVTEASLAFEKRMGAQDKILRKPFEADQLRTAIFDTLARHVTVEYKHRKPAQKKIATATKTGHPDPSRLLELEEYLSLDILHSQFQELRSQIQQLIESAPRLEIQELAQDAHKLAGAAGMLGISDIEYCLRSCQNAAAAGDRAAASSQLAEIPALTAAFATFVAEYAAK